MNMAFNSSYNPSSDAWCENLSQILENLVVSIRESLSFSSLTFPQSRIVTVGFFPHPLKIWMILSRLKFLIEISFTARILSPICRPALAAGDPGYQCISTFDTATNVVTDNPKQILNAFLDFAYINWLISFDHKSKSLGRLFRYLQRKKKFWNNYKIIHENMNQKY